MSKIKTITDYETRVRGNEREIEIIFCQRGRSGGFQYLVEGINDLGKTIHLYEAHSSPQINYHIIGDQGYAGLFFIKQQSHEGPVHQND